MKKFWKIGVLLVLVIVLAFGLISSGAWFSDVETTQNNAFTAGTLDLKVNGGDAPVTIFNVGNMVPGNQPTGSILLKNDGSISGKLTIDNVVVTSFENGCGEPEAGDTTCGNPGEGLGELQDVLGFRFYIDADKDGYYSAGDVMLFGGMMGGLPSSIAVTKTLAPGEVVRLNYVVDWWSTPTDNLAQSDGVKIDMTFGLTQIH